MGGKSRKFLNQRRKGHVKYSAPERSRGKDPVYFLPFTITFSTAVQPMSATASKSPIPQCWVSRKGMKYDYSSVREAKTTTSLRLNRGKRAAGHLFHGLTFPQYWSHNTNKTSVWGWGRGAAEELGLSLKGKANGDAGRGEFPVASWAMQQQTAGHLYWVRKHSSNPLISSPPHQEQQRQELSKS